MLDREPLVVNRRTKIVDGFDVYKAAQRASHDEADPKETASSTAVPPPANKGASKVPAAHIGRTVMPTKLEIICQECSYEFTITGRTPKTFCPKCKNEIELGDHVLSEEKEFSITTGGKITIEEAGILTGGELIATDIRIDGKVEAGSLKSFRWMELGPGAKFPEEAIESRDLRIAEGAKVSFKRKIEYRNIELLGELSAKVKCSGQLTILPGGLLKGSFEGNHLRVEEGGGLKAKVKLEADGELDSAKTAVS